MSATITLWLLISLGSSYSTASRPTVVVERFIQEVECERVAKVLNSQESRRMHQCVEAKVYRP